MAVARAHATARPARRPRPSAAASPSSSAVPEGASTLWRWCISRISMSKSAPSAAAACRTSAARRLTPRLMLPDWTMRAWRAAARAWRNPARRGRSCRPRGRCGLGGERGELDGRGGRGEIENAVGVGEGGQRIVGDRDAERADPGEEAGVLPERRRALALDRAGEPAAFGLGDGLDQRAPHPPGGAHHHEPHLRHAAEPLAEPRRGFSRRRFLGASARSARARFPAPRAGRGRRDERRASPCGVLARFLYRGHCRSGAARPAPHAPQPWAGLLLGPGGLLESEGSRHG